MSRIRSIHPGLATDEAFMAMSPAAKAAWMLLWTECDDGGVFPWKPAVLKARLLPADAVDFAAILAEFEALDCVLRFSVDGKEYGAVRNFARYQRPKSPKLTFPRTEEAEAFVGNCHASAVTDGPMKFTRDATAADRKRAQRERERDEGGNCHASAVTDGEVFPENGEVSRQMEEEGGRRKEKIEPIAQHLEPAAPRDKPALVDRLAEAAGIRGNLGPGLAFPGEIIALLEGYDLEREVLPAIRAKPNPNARKWSYFVPQIHDYVRRVRDIAADAQSAPKAHQFDWRRALEVFREGTWAAGWGPKPGERGCRVPASLLAEFGFERAA